MHYNF